MLDVQVSSFGPGSGAGANGSGAESMHDVSEDMQLRMQAKALRPLEHGDAALKVAELVQNIDYAPTFLELAGVEIPDDIQGISLMPLLEGEHPQDWRSSLYYHFYEYPAEHMVKRHYGVRTERYKLIHFYDDIDQWELYDLQTDPTEMNNLFDKPGYESIIEKLKQELVGLQTLYGDSIEYRLRDKKL